MILYLLFNQADGFPSSAEKGIRKGAVKASDKFFVIQDLPTGNYAVSVIHDENSNNELDTFMGIPKEGFGFSNNPRIYFGPPDFNESMFKLESDLTIKVEMKEL